MLAVFDRPRGRNEFPSIRPPRLRHAVAGLPHCVAPEDRPDADADGVWNQAEARNGTDPYCVDSDGDGLSDFVEWFNGLLDGSTADTDSDGVDDYTELMRRTNPSSWDTDGDGVSDQAEHLLGTDPLDPDE